MGRSRRLDIVDLGDEPLEHDGAVVVIDVIRAFTSTAAAFGAGARRITCVAGLDEALAWRSRDPSVVLMGEEHGQRPDGFDLGNSPVEIAAASTRLAGAAIVQRTSNGTRGLAASTSPVVLAAAATSAAATAAHLDAHHPSLDVLLLCTGTTAEDRACAEYLVELLRHGQGHGDRDRLVAGIEAGARQHEDDWRSFHGEAGVRAFRADVAHCTAVDRYARAMVGTRTPDGVVLAPHPAA